MIEVEHLSYAYGKTAVLSDVSFSAGDSECVAILGNNGVGKSTLVTCVNRIRTPSSGTIRIDGEDAFALSRLELAKRVAYVAQKNEMSRVTVFDCVLLGRKPYFGWTAGDEDLERCADMIRRTGLSHLQLRSLDTLSGGELQKAMLARALVQEPRVLLLDEPTSSLDPSSQYGMMELVRQITKERGLTSLIVLHDLNLALRFCDRFLFLKEGRAFCCGGPEVVTGETIESVYGIPARVAELDGRRVAVIG